MKDYQTLLAEATTECIVCGNKFTIEVPCCCDEARFETATEVRHPGGICRNCCQHSPIRRAIGTERSE